MKKRIALLVLAFVVGVMTIGCGDEKKKSVVEQIGLDKYEWKTSYNTIYKKEVTKNMVEGEDFFCIENGTEIAKDLAVDVNIGGTEYRKYYSFNMDDELVSVMVMLNAVLNYEETAEVYLKLAEEYQKKYGEPLEVYNEYTEEEYISLEAYANQLALGAITSSYTWMDEEGNQTLLYAAQGDEYIDVILLYDMAQPDMQ